VRSRDQDLALVEIREGDETFLAEVIGRGLGHLDSAQLRALFLNPNLTARMVRRILERPEHLETRAVRKALAAHRRTPLQDALRLVSTLFWNDLIELGRDTRVLPGVRRAAHQSLKERYEGLAVGERIAIARGAGVEMLPRVRLDPEPRVIQALLENPRLTEGVVQGLAAGTTTRPPILAVIAASPKWSARPEVRRQLCRNRGTPVEVVLPLLSRLDKRDLEGFERLPGLHEAVRQRARILLGKGSLG